MADGKVTLSTALENSGLIKGIKNISGALGGLTNVVKKLGVGLAAAFATAAVAITKQAVDAYADYEQLTGGIETLFKDSASKVVAYAEDAFYTAGVSANKYMEIVTGFSASLITAMGGDTEKAADVANMALIDMSDNANKMGTALESIQVAYQGFSKQNYTMLDNLKLGYGGTKTEMERLLADANRINAEQGKITDYSIDNLADVYSAIHVIQKEFGIAGATAAEAEGTISGSAAMTAAAWENVLAAISGGGDLDRAINNLVFAISKYFENIVPVVERSLAGIGQLIEKVAPQLVQTVATALIQAIPSLLSAVYQMILGLAKGIYQGIVALFTGGSAGAIKAELNDVAGSAGAAADAQQDLADATEAAGKAAKKSLAGFDELNKLQGDSGGSPSAASVGGFSAGGISVDAEVEDGVSPKIEGIVTKIQELLAPLREIDFTPAVEAFGRLGSAIGGLGATIGGVLLWAWEHILVPLVGWIIEDAVPAIVDLLAAALEVVGDELEKFVGLLSGEISFSEFVASLSPVETILLGIAAALGAIKIAAAGMSVLNTITTFFANIKALSTAGIIGKIAELFSVLGGAAGPVTSLADAMQMVFGPGSIFAGIGAVIGGVILAVTNFFSMLSEGFSWLKEILMVVGIAIAAIGAVILGAPAAVAAAVAAIVAAIATAVVLIKEHWAAISGWFDEKVIQPVSKFFTELWGNICTGASDAWEGIKEFFSPAVEWFTELLDSVGQTFSDIFHNVGVIVSGCWEIIKAVWGVVSEWFSENVVTPVADFFTGLWEGFVSAASRAWEAVKAVFGKVAEFFKGVFSKAWEGVVAVFSVAGEIFTDIKDGILTAFKSIVNGIIKGLNAAISIPFNGINTALRKIRDIKIIGLTPFSGLRTISVPQIPYLAQGAVLPANKPFLAMVGDQRHGTNVEAPLSTIQEAVALVMEDMTGGMMAGFEATVAVLKEILEAIYGIEIGDEVIVKAAQRYQEKMAIVKRGG